VALNLSTAGYKRGTVTNATDQTRTTTTVAYLPGFRRDAVAVATSLKLPASSVAPVDQPTESVACPPPAACAANVVVTVGSNLANIP
jgi:LytR cell envelope-related transcriptional attenuator